MDGGMLSQDEINALLSGMDGGGSNDDSTSSLGEPSSEIDETLLTDVERDAIGEVANISMGSSATTLYSLVNRKVNITTPIVTLANWQTVIKGYERPCVFIQIKYTHGLDGSNILILKEQDVKIITDLMMGGDGTNVDVELGELHLSAISEAMNQMMGSSATSLSSMLGTMIDISPPEASLVDVIHESGGEIANFLDNTFVKIAFTMQIADLVDSTILQLYPVDFAKSLYDTFLNMQMGTSSAKESPKLTEPASYVPPQAPPEISQGMQQQGYSPEMGYPPQSYPQMGMPQIQPQGYPAQGYPQQGYPPQSYPQMPMQGGFPQMQPQMTMPQQSLNIQPAQFQSFSGGFNPNQTSENISLIMDVPLEVTVELGRAKKSISDILEFAPGTIIELDRIAGEPIDVLVNGKFVARGEVVVIEESFGVRVTEIIK